MQFFRGASKESFKEPKLYGLTPAQVVSCRVPSEIGALMLCRPSPYIMTSLQLYIMGYKLPGSPLLITSGKLLNKSKKLLTAAKARSAARDNAALVGNLKTIQRFSTDFLARRLFVDYPEHKFEDMDFDMYGRLFDSFEHLASFAGHWIHRLANLNVCNPFFICFFSSRTCGLIPLT